MIARLKPADVVLGLSALALLVLLAFDWFSASARAVELHTTGWASLGWLAVLLVAGAAVLALVVAGLLATGARDSVSLPPHVVLAVLAPLAFLVLLVVVLTKPGLGAGLPGDAVAIEPAAWLGLGAGALVWLASWFSIGHERKDVPDRIVAPPSPPLPAPPAAPEN